MADPPIVVFCADCYSLFHPVQLSDLEQETLLAGGAVRRFCPTCGKETSWQGFIVDDKDDWFAAE